MELPDGRLGLIDFGQTKHLEEDERLAFARVVADVGSQAPPEQIAKSMRLAGFRTKDEDDETLAAYAGLFFDSDHVSKEKGYATPQDYFQSLMDKK
jgi:aarF domain-containing kinase